MEINSEEASLIMESEKALIIDIRDYPSYRESHIEGSMLNHDGLMQALIKNKEYDRPVIIYCYHGNSSRDMAEFISALGFKKVYSLKGGYVAWAKWISEKSKTISQAG